MALKLAELDRNSPNPQGGELEHNASGELTGMLKEKAPPWNAFAMRIPEATAEQRRRGILLVLADLAKNGVTSAQDNSEWTISRLQQLKEDGKLTVRITEWLHSPSR